MSCICTPNPPPQLTQQEVLVLCACETAAFAFVVAMMADDPARWQLWQFIFMMTSNGSLQFHQLSWLCITLLR